MVSPDSPPQATGSKPRIFACSSVALDYFRFLCESLAASATRVIEVAPVGEDHYRRSARGSRMTRLGLRLQMYVMYPLRLCVATFQARRGDLFVVTSNTFFAPMLVAFLVGWRGVRVIHLLYDLFPDAMEVSGATRTRGLLARSLGAVTWANQHLTDGTVYLGDFLRDYAERRWGRTRRPGVVPIATDVRLYATPVPASVAPTPLVMHYGGQLGRLHDVDSLVESLRQLSRAGLLGKEVSFEGLVSGAWAIALEDALRGIPGATVGGTLSSHEWRRHVQSCQIGIVTLSPGGATVCLPSKTYAMMAAGLAVIAVCPAWSDLAELVRETGAGWVVDNAARRQPLEGSDYLTACRSQRPTADVAADFEGLVSRLVASPHEVLECRRNAWKAVRERFSPDRITQAWGDYLRPLSIAERNA